LRRRLVFSSPIFLNWFLPATLLLVMAAHRAGGARLANPLLLAASVIFYMWGVGAAFAPILLGSVISNFLLGRWAQHARDGGQSRRMPVAATVIVNLALLGWFKYGNFFVAETARLREMIGVDPFLWKEIVLPIGISFFTFQAMSYVFDVAAGRARALKNPFDYALYIILFPQLIAGPIVRYGQIAEQIGDRPLDLRGVREGAVRFVHGLVKKVAIADAAGAVADPIFGLPAGELTMGAAWIGAIAYFVQIYFDFSGYSDMAIGLGRMVGFSFPENFDRPYAALSITDFWRRWHMTLSGWFRDYVYVPLGGSRRGELSTYVNLWTVFTLTGLWHGANWTFLVWGLYHGGLLVAERLLGVREPPQSPGLAEYILRRVGVTALVLCGWIIFRAPDLSFALDYFAAMADGAIYLPDDLATRLRSFDLALMAVGFTIAVLPPARFRGPDLYQGALRAPATALLFCVAWPFALMKAMAGGYSPFLYFQF